LVNVSIHESATINSSATVGAGSRIGEGTIIGDRAVIGANVDIGSGVVVLADVVVHSYSRIMDGSVVTESVAARSIVEGDPAITTGFVGATEWSIPSGGGLPSLGDRIAVGVGHCAVIGLPNVSDSRGSLLPIELDQDLPFVPRRLFFVHGVVDGGVRGQHAHRECDQLLFAISGSAKVVLDDGSASVQVRLNRPEVSIYLPAGVWVTHYEFSRSAVLAVLAEYPYDPHETISDYDAFLSWRSDLSDVSRT
jgi:UDP-2-acetamido-3-amino-2,3-dideoxy-glucuronate N-acetyltransferase